jgi:hypothetical protein
LPSLRSRARAERTVLCLVILSACGNVLAADPIDTDGPDFVESSEVVPEGRFQYELDARARESSLLLKQGVGERFELRLTLARHDAPGFGFKWHALDRDAASGRPAVAWIADIEKPALRSVLTWDLPHALSLGVMPGIRYETADDGRRFASGIFGAVLNERVSQSMRMFVELSATHFARWDLGAAYLIGRDAQIGARAGAGYVIFELAQRF